MKKLLTFALALGLTLAAKAGSFTPISEDFINNGTYVCLTNGLTATFYGVQPSQAVGVSATYGTNLWFFDYTVGTNVLGQLTNSIGNYLHGALCDVDLFPDGNANLNTNCAIVATFGITNQYPLQGVMSPVVQNTIWTNPAAQWFGAIPGTNTVIIIFAPVSDLQGNIADNTQGRQFTWTNNLEGLTLPITTSISLPPTFAGSRRLRVVSITVSANAVSGSLGVVLDKLALQGYTP